MLPFPIKPMLLQIAHKPFDSPKHLFEWKVDGVRCVMFYQQGRVRLHSKTGRDCTPAFPELHHPVLDAREAILDGEVTVLVNGKPDFEAVMERYMAGSKKTAALTATKPAFFLVWDVLWHNHRQVTHLPLIDRKQLLDQTLEDSPGIRKIDYIDTQGLALWQGVLDQDLEGMVAKRKDSPYLFKRSSAWVKIKNHHLQVVDVMGYSKKHGAVLVGDGSKVQGQAMGMKPEERDVLWKLLNEYGTIKGDHIYLPPGVRGRVKYTTWTSKGSMRDCIWVGFQL